MGSRKTYSYKLPSGTRKRITYSSKGMSTSFTQSSGIRTNSKNRKYHTTTFTSRADGTQTVRNTFNEGYGAGYSASYSTTSVVGGSRRRRSSRYSNDDSDFAALFTLAVLGIPLILVVLLTFLEPIFYFVIMGLLFWGLIKVVLWFSDWLDARYEQTQQKKLKALKKQMRQDFDKEEAKYLTT